MIRYETATLDNGLTVAVNRDRSSKLAAVNILYKVGARNEDAEHTGFAHLFEHLMSAHEHVARLRRTGTNGLRRDTTPFPTTTTPISTYAAAREYRDGAVVESDCANAQPLTLARGVRHREVGVIEEVQAALPHQPVRATRRCCCARWAYKVHLRWSTIGMFARPYIPGRR